MKPTFAVACVLLLTGCAQSGDDARPRGAVGCDAGGRAATTCGGRAGCGDGGRFATTCGGGAGCNGGGRSATRCGSGTTAAVRNRRAPRAAPLDRAGYLAVADTLAARLSPLWQPRQARYRAGRGTITVVNADLLIVHATAALARHRGASRDDARAVAIVRFLTSPPVWAGPGQGWQAGPDNKDRHEVFQAEVIEALQTAYRARATLKLDAQLVERIQREVALVARGKRWRWPALRLNQFNWPATFAHADAVVNGREQALATTLHRRLARFTREARGTDGRAGNLAGGLRFQYLPDSIPQDTMNLDSAEYANIVLSFARTYPRARAAGMPRPTNLKLLHAWIRRVISGSWTHGGDLNWDTGLGFERWWQRKKTGLAQGALIGIAAAPELQPSPRWGAWAKWLLDRGLTQYVALVERENRIPDAVAYDLDVVPLGPGHAYLAASRQAANAMRALTAGLGEQPGLQPPPLYAFDPDTGRLAVTTPTYSTAIVPANQRAFPYGGLDLARLLNDDNAVAGTLGGTGAAGFGLRVGTLRTQYGERPYGGEQPLQLLRPRRVQGPATALRAYAGPFRDLRVRGSAPAGTVEYRFTSARIEATWAAHATGGVVTFPSWGDTARIERVRRGVYAIHSERAGYTVRLRGARATRIVHPRPQRANPHPGPSLEVALAGTTLSVQIVPD